MSQPKNSEVLKIRQIANESGIPFATEVLTDLAREKAVNADLPVVAAAFDALADKLRQARLEFLADLTDVPPSELLYECQKCGELFKSTDAQRDFNQSDFVCSSCKLLRMIFPAQYFTEISERKQNDS